MSDFEIQISGAAGSYRVAARSVAGDTGDIPVVFPFDDVELGRQLQVLEMAVMRSSATVRRLTSPDERPVQEFGRRLFEFAFPPEVRTQLAASRQQAVHQGEPLRVRLRVGPSELAALPWEFLYEPDRDDYLALGAPLVRYVETLEPRRPLEVTPPLRVLAMTARPDELGALDAELEERRLIEALSGLQDSGAVQLDWVRGQTWWDLRAALDREDWHIFHFIGHGELDSRTGEGTLAFADDRGGVHRIGANDFARLIVEEQPLRLVVLNSCDSARARADDRFSSTASMLMRRGIPAVVAMQYEISDQAAITFARGFYTALAAQQPVDQAITRARQSVKLAHQGSLEWATPVLYLRSDTGKLFELTRDAAPPPRRGTTRPSPGTPAARGPVRGAFRGLRIANLGFWAVLCAGGSIVSVVDLASGSGENTGGVAGALVVFLMITILCARRLLILLRERDG